jgi:hypothetical protein
MVFLQADFGDRPAGFLCLVSGAIGGMNIGVVLVFIFGRLYRMFVEKRAIICAELLFDLAFIHYSILFSKT